MNDFARIMAAAAGGMTAQSARMRLTAENLANVDTPGYRRKMITFEEVAGPGAVRPGRLSLQPGELPKVYDPAHPMAGPEGYYDGSNVQMVVELADAREARRSYEANVQMLDQARSMARGLLDLLRR